MVEFNGLTLQLENLKVLHEDAKTKVFSLSTINLLAKHIKEIEKAIEERKILLEKKTD